jgi:hypothetical protein
MLQALRLRQLAHHLTHASAVTASTSCGIKRRITLIIHDTNKACRTIPPFSPHYEPKGKVPDPGYGFTRNYVVIPDNSEAAGIRKSTSLEIPISSLLFHGCIPFQKQPCHSLIKTLGNLLFIASTVLLIVIPKSSTSCQASRNIFVQATIRPQSP